MKFVFERESLRPFEPVIGMIKLGILILMAMTSVHAEENLFARTSCDGPKETQYSVQAMADKLGMYQVLSEEALSLRSEAITFLAHLKEKQRLKQPLLGSDMRYLSEGAADLLNQRKQLWDVATAHECWLDAPIPEDPQQADTQAMGITMSLSAALTLYDNYLTAVALYRDNPFLRTHLNQGDAGFQIPEGELRKIAKSFTSARNRLRVRRGLIWYEQHAAHLGQSDDDDQRYLAMLVDQSPAYSLVRKIRPLDYAGNVIDLIGTSSVDTLNVLQKEGVNLSSMIFGNVVGLVESRRGKLDNDPQVFQRVAGELKAGDVLLEKTPFRLTDSFIPGHWGHAAVWIGTEQELRQMGLWGHPVVAKYHAQIRQGRGVVEALRSGVEINSLSHFMNVDDLAVLRHRDLDLDARRDVILQSLRQVGKAYDFNFDTQSTDRIVCSELVYHAYGDVSWPTERKLGRVVVSPDNIAQEAINGGAFQVALLYHDGHEVLETPKDRFAKLIEPRVVAMARGNLTELSP
jgi:uncharacterized protein YycO